MTDDRLDLEALCRSTSVADPELIEARRALHEAELAHAIDRTLAEAPPLTDAQRRKIRAALLPTLRALALRDQIAEHPTWRDTP